MSDIPSLFEIYSKFGDRQSDGTNITSKNVDKWLKQAGLVGVPKAKFTPADTAITFSKIAKNQQRINLPQFEQFLEGLADAKKMDVGELKNALIKCGAPQMTNVTQACTSGAVGKNLDRMTDTSGYTGAHKSRFDEEGKGKGIAGREDAQSTSGYVTGFKDKKKEEEDEKKKKK